HISTLETAWHSPPQFITTWPAGHRRQIAACADAVITCCEGQIFLQYLLNAVSSRIQLKLPTLKTLPTVRNLPKKLQQELAGAIPSRALLVPLELRPRKAFRCNRISIRPGSPVPKRAGRSGQPRKVLDGRRRRLHPNRPKWKRAWRHQIERVNWTCQF